MPQKAILALDIGGSKVMCGAVTPSGEVLHSIIEPLLSGITSETLIALLTSCGKKVMEAAKNVKFTVIGATIPGLADFRAGMWVYSCFSQISNFPITAVMSEKLGLPMYVENDVNACALAEKLFGICRETSDYLWVTVSNGVGGGLVLSGELYTGAFLNAGEFGHLCVSPEGAICPCGNRGCIEAMASGRAIERRYAELSGSSATGGEIAQRAKAGDAVAVQTFDEAGYYIGYGLSMAANLLNLEKYVLGGGVMQSYDLMEDAITHGFNRHVFASANKGSVICKTGLGYQAGLLGAAAIAVKGGAELL